MNTKRLASLIVGTTVALTELLVFLPSAKANSAQCNWYFQSDGLHGNCTINQPEVRQAKTEYENVEFHDKDIVTIDAGGCVQTGGAGKTWKRYVNPAANNDLYHGLFRIPGMTFPYFSSSPYVPGGFSRFPTTGTSTSHFTFTYDKNMYSYLILGFEDDGYSDNGYWGHDNGTGDQCKNIGDAYVKISIHNPSEHGSANTKKSSFSRPR